MSLNTGGGGQITFSQLGTFAFRTLDGSGSTAPQINGTPLAQTGTFSYLKPDTQSLEVFAAEIFFDAEVGLPQGITRDGVITITWPLGEGEATPATLIGVGWIPTLSYPRLEHNLEQIANIEIQWQDTPAFTAAA